MPIKICTNYKEENNNIFQAKKHETKIKSIITVSNIHSINETSQISNIGEADIIALVEKLNNYIINGYLYTNKV